MDEKFELKEVKMGDHKLIDERWSENSSEVENINCDDTLIENHKELTSNKNMIDNNRSINTMETESYKSDSEHISTDFESMNSDVSSAVSKSINKEITNNQLIVLEPNNPIMTRFQNTLKQHLLKQRDNLKQELVTLDGVIRSKKNEKSSLISEINNTTYHVDTQQQLFDNLHREKKNLEIAKKQIETCIIQRKQCYNENTLKTASETKKLSDLKRQLDSNQGLLKELSKYEKEQEITFNMCHQKKSQTKQYKKKLLNDQLKQDLLLLSLTQEILRLEDRMKQLGEQAETKYNERELLKQKVTNSSTDLDAFNGDNAKITLLWNEVLISIQQRDKAFQKIKIDFQEAKNKYHILLMEANSYKRSAQEESHKNNELLSFLNKLKREQNNLQNSFKMCLDKFNYLKDEYSKLIQITEFQDQNLNQVLLDQKSINNEINTLLHVLDKKRNLKSRYQEDVLDELKKKLFADNSTVQINKKISELNVQNKEHELVLVSSENNLTQALLELEQNRITSSNLEKDLAKNTKYLNDQGVVLSTLDSELKKIHTEIQNKSRQIDLENKQLETLKKRQEDGYIMNPQMQIDQVKHKIDQIRKESDLIKESWVQNQNKNAQLLDQRNKQLNELSKVQKYALVMNTKNLRLEQEIVSLTKEVDQYKRTLSNMRNMILKLNENFSRNKGKSSQLLNENEFLQCSYLAEMKENEKQYLKYIDQLKLLKSDLIDIKNVYIEKQRESKSWDSKVQSLVQMKKELKNNEGDLGDIDAMKNEIHRMQIRESQLKKTLEKIMIDLELCISRRAMIYNTVAAKDIRLKGKNETKQRFLKKLDDLRFNIKKIKIECKKLDQSINDLQHGKIELESKLTYLNNNIIHVQKEINDLIENIEDIGAAKLKNINKLSYQQSRSKFLDECNKGKYRLLIKNDSKMNEEFAAGLKKNSDLISVVEALKNDFPFLDFQITRMLNILKSIDGQ